MTELLDNFFNEKGIIKKSISEFNPSQETKIQIKKDELVYPTLQKLAKVLNAYSDCKAKVNLEKGDAELEFSRNSALKFVYRVRFSVKGEDIFVTGQYGIPDIYDEVDFKDTNLKKVIKELTASDIKDDFSNAFTNNVNIE